MVKVGKCALIGIMHKKWTLSVELTKKTSHCKSRDFLRKRRLKKSGQGRRLENGCTRNRELNNQISKKLEEMQTYLDTQILLAIDGTFNESVISEIQVSLEWLKQ